MFRQMKDMKAMVTAAPAMVQAAQAAGAQAQQLAAHHQAQQQAAVAHATTVAPALSEADLAPIAGVTLERYAEVSRGLAAHGYDPTKATLVAAGLGIGADDWQAAQDGWNARMVANPAVASAFNRLYTGR